MEKIRVLVSRPQLIVFLNMAFLMFSCQDYLKEEVKSFTGEEIFEGLIFGKGQVADLIPMVKASSEVQMVFDSDNELSLEIEAIHELIMDDIRINNVAFFEEFKSKMTSGNQLLIKEGFEHAAIELLSSYERLSGYNYNELIQLTSGIIDKYNLSTEDSDQFIQNLQTFINDAKTDNLSNESNRDNCIAIVSVVALAVILATAAVIGAVVLVDSAYVFSSVSVAGIQRNGNSKDTLLFEEIIDKVATSLSY